MFFIAGVHCSKTSGTTLKLNRVFKFVSLALTSSQKDTLACPFPLKLSTWVSNGPLNFQQNRCFVFFLSQTCFPLRLLHLRWFHHLPCVKDPYCTHDTVHCLEFSVTKVTPQSLSIASLSFICITFILFFLFLFIVCCLWVSCRLYILPELGPCRTYFLEPRIVHDAQ